MLENGADIRFIQQMLGHSKLSSRQIYTQVSIPMLKHVHAATHPAQLWSPAEMGKLLNRKVVEQVREVRHLPQGIRELQRHRTGPQAPERDGRSGNNLGTITLPVCSKSLQIHTQRDS